MTTTNLTGRFLAKINLFVYLTIIGSIVTGAGVRSDDDIIRADLPITKVDHILSDIYCIANPKAKQYKAHERLVEQIEINAFINCTELVTLDLDSNRMESLRTGVFGLNLNTLESLNLGNNRLDYLHRDTFMNLTNLKALQLWDNYLHALHKDTFKHNIRLEKLQLYGNHLEFIHPGTFANLINLKVLHLDNNKLKALQPKVIQNLAKLERFYFYSNELTTIDQDAFMHLLTNIKEVNFNNNDFSCTEVDRIYLEFSKKPDLNITSFVESNPRRPDATNTTHDDLYCVPEDEWEKKSNIYRQRAVRAEIFYDLQMSMDEQRGVIDEVKMTLQTMQANFIAETTHLRATLNNGMKEMADLKLQISQLKLTNLELLNSKLKLEEDYREMKYQTHDKISINGFGGMVNLNCKVEAHPSLASTESQSRPVYSLRSGVKRT